MANEMHIENGNENIDKIVIGMTNLRRRETIKNYAISYKFCAFNLFCMNAFN